MNLILIGKGSILFSIVNKLSKNKSKIYILGQKF